MINMMDVREIRTNLEAVANQIEPVDKRAATRLRDLSRAVEGSPYTYAWAGSNVHELIESSTIIERYKSQRKTEGIIAVLEWVRNSLIFAPLVVTWYGISQAVDKYTLLIQSDQTQIQQPFLYLWQEGFGGRLPKWQALSGIASIDFTLLLIVLLLTIAVYSLSNTIRLKREQEAEDLRDTLVHAVAGATLYLTRQGQQRGQPVDITTRLETMTTRFESTMGPLVAQISAIVDRQKQDLQTFTTFKNDLNTFMRTVTSAATEMKNSTNALNGSITALVAPVHELATKQTAFLQGSQEAIELFKKQILIQDAVIKEQQKWGTDLRNTLNRLGATVNTAEGLAKNIETFSRQQAGFLEEIKLERDKQGQLANEVFSAMKSIKEAVEQLHNASTEINAINVNMDQIIRRLAAASATRR